LLDGSVNLQVVCNVRLSRKDTRDHTIWVKARVVNGIAQIAECTKHLFVNSKGILQFHINGFGTMYGRTYINDGQEH